MKTFGTIVVTVWLAAAVAPATGASRWGYSGPTGPQNWGALSPRYRLCVEGKNQSPVDLTGLIEADLPLLAFDYQAGGGEVVNNGHTVQVNYTAGSTISFPGQRFELRQFHFHAPSENLIEGRSYPMEAHLVHSDGDGALAVVAVMLVEGERNATIEQVWDHLPERAGEKESLLKPIAAQGLLPDDRDYYRFNGSLTTPPCTEGVWWFVMRQPVSVSGDQIERFRTVIGHANNRPVQPLGARAVLR